MDNEMTFDIKRSDLESVVIPKYQPDFPEIWK